MPRSHTHAPTHPRTHAPSHTSEPSALKTDGAEADFDEEGGEGGGEGHLSEDGSDRYEGGQNGARIGTGRLQTIESALAVGSSTTTALRVADELGVESDEEEADSPSVVAVDVEAGSWVRKGAAR